MPRGRNERKESGIDDSFDGGDEDDSSAAAASSSVPSSDPETVDRRRRSGCVASSSVARSPSSALEPSARAKASLTGRRQQRLRFQSKLMLLKQQEQGLDCQKTCRKTSQLGSNPKSQSSIHLLERGRHQIEGNHQIANNSLKNQVDSCFYQRHSKERNFKPSSAPVNLALSQRVPMKFNILKTSLSSEAGYADGGSPASSTASISEVSEADQFSLGNVEVKALDELPEELSELLSHASYQDGVSGLMPNGKGKVLFKTSSSCPSETVAQPKYRGGRKKEAPPPNMTPEQRSQWEKERQKKDNHNHIERRRRDKINECIRVLSLIVPNGDDNISNSLLGETGNLDAQKKEYNKKGAVLEAAVNYIRRLQSEQKQMEEFRKQQEVLQRANRSLMLEIQQLQSRAQQVHISSPHLSPPAQGQQVMLQYQPPFEPQPSLDQEHLQQPNVHLGSVQLLVASGHPHVPPTEIQHQQHLQQDQQNIFLSEFANFMQESNSERAPLVAGNYHFNGHRFETVAENVFLDEPENDFQELSLMDHGFVDVIPDRSTAIDDYSVDDLFGAQSAQLNGDPLLSNATDVPMASEFDDLFIPLAL